MSIFEKLVEALSALPDELYIFVISMLPIVELRGSIPIGAILEVPFYLNYIIAVIGNMVPIPFILLFIPKILDFLEKYKPFKPIVGWLKGKADKNSKKVFGECEASAQSEDNGVILGSTEQQLGKAEESIATAKKRTASRKMTKTIFIALALFVALPLPGTGAWSGGLVAALFDLPKKTAFVSILLGVMICGIIMCLASYGILGFLSFLL